MAEPRPWPDSPPAWPGTVHNTERLRLYVRRTGPEDAEKVVLLHGWAVHGGMFQGLREGLDHRFDLLVPDLRGHGYSDAPKGDWSPEGMADDIAALLDHLELERVHLVGYSLGGVVALAMAQRHPGRIHRLGLLCTAPHTHSKRRRAGLAALQQGLKLLPPSTMSRITKGLLSGPGMPEEMSYVLPWLMQHNSRRGLSGGAKLLSRADLRPGLAAIPHEALVVTAGKDAAFAPRDSQVLLDHLKTHRHEHFAEAGHGLAASHGEQLAELLEEFLQEGI